MLISKTRFDQVPLEVVKKIVAEQIKKEELAERTSPETFYNTHR